MQGGWGSRSLISIGRDRSFRPSHFDKLSVTAQVDSSLSFFGVDVEGYNGMVERSST